MTPVRVQLRRIKGWRMPENTIKADRTTKLGNPFWGGPPDECVEKHRQLLLAGVGGICPYDPCKSQRQYKCLQEAIEARKRSYRKNIACWCSLDEPCHADNLLRFFNPDLWTL